MTDDGAQRSGESLAEAAAGGDRAAFDTLLRQGGDLARARADEARAAALDPRYSAIAPHD